MLTFMLRWWCFIDHGVGGVGCERSCSYYAGDVLLIMGRGGMLTLMFRFCWWCYVDHGVGWGGMGWDVNVHVHVTLMMLRWSWGGMGWDVNVHVHVTLKLFHGWSSLVFGKWKKTGVQGCMIGEVHANPLKTTRRLSAPFPTILI